MQIVRALSPARVVAVDLDPRKLELARAHGADEAVLGGDGAVERVRAVAPDGVDAVFDFVGSQETVDAGAALVSTAGWLVIKGIGGGVLRHGDRTSGLRSEVKVVRTSYGTVDQLREVIELARRGLVVAEVTRFPLDVASEAIAGLERGDIVGRAVLCP